MNSTHNKTTGVSPGEHPKSVVKNLVTLVTSDPYLRSIRYTQPEDVFVVGFPKSGNTWMQSIVACLKYGMLPETLPESLAQDLVPDVHAKRFYKRYGNFMTFKSHALPNKSYRRVIYLVRDGRDAMASYYGMYQNMGIQANLDAMIRQGKHLFPCKWHAHITAWEANPYGAEMEYIRYEDLLLNPLPELHKICQVLGVNYDKDFLLNVVEGNSFDAMKQRAKVLGTAHKYYDKHAEGHTFFRKGKMGSYKEDIPEHLIRFFEEEASEQLFRYKYL